MSTEQESAAATWPRVVKLKYPVTFNDEVISSLTFQRGRAGDIRGIKLNPADVAANDLMLIASRLSGQPVKVIEMLDVEDVGEVTDIALDFYAKFLAAGKRR